MKKFVCTFLFFLLGYLSIAQSAKSFHKNAKKAWKENKYEVVVDNLNKAIELENGDDKYFYLRGQAYEKLEKNSMAVTDYIAAANLEPKEKNYNQSAGRLLYDQSRFKEAIVFLDKVLDDEKENIEALLLKSKSYYSLREFEQSFSVASKAVDIKENKDNYFQKGISALELKKWIVAEKALVNTAKLDGNYPYVYTKLTIARMGIGNYKKAIASADKAIELFHKDKQAYYLRAESNKKLNNLKGSVDDITHLISFFPKDEEAYFKRAQYNLENNNKVDAKKDFSKAINLNSNFIEALDARATLYDEMKESKLACRDYESILKIKSEKQKDQKYFENAKLRVFEINKESNAPEIKILEPELKDNSIDIVANNTIKEFKIHVKDESPLESIVFNGRTIDFDKVKKNPFIVHKADLKNEQYVRVDAIDVYNNKASVTYNVKVKKIKPPVIKLLEPYASTNGETYIDKDISDLFVEGKISHTEKIASVKVNGIIASFIENSKKPTFSAKIDISKVENFSIEVEDVFGTKAVRNYKLIRTEISADNPMGKTWVVFIENSNYSSFSSLEGPTKDINLIKSSLSEYDVSKIIHKKDMKKADLEKFFAIELRDLIKKNRVNSMMVWYAGHGKFVNETGYWIPTDAKRDEEYSYFNINSLRASMQSYDKVLLHNLVITDACESGPSFYLAMRDVPEERRCGDWEATKFRSAQVLSSAGYELAMDNSQFTKTFSSMLMHNPDMCIPIEKISTKVIEAVAQTGNQKPSLGKIKGLSDQNGTFFFIKKEK